MSPGVTDDVDHQQTKHFQIEPNPGSQAIIQVEKGKVSAEILKNGISIEHNIIDAGVSKPFDFTKFSPDHKFTFVITGIAPTTSKFQVSGNVIPKGS